MRDKAGGYTKAELEQELYEVRGLYTEAQNRQGAAEIRALKLEQALRFVIIEAHRGMDSGLDISEMFYALRVICGTASAALDKPDQM